MGLVRRRDAALAATAIAAFVWWRVHVHESAVGASGGDFAVYRNAALVLLGGGDPYAGTVLLYPLPAILAVVPLVWLPPVIGAATFAALGMFALTYGALRVKGWPGLTILASPACFLGWYYLQWSPLITAGAFLPWLGGFGACKPNLEFGALAYRPRWEPILGGGFLVLLSFLVLPSWPAEWIADVRQQTTAHAMVLLWPLGFVGIGGLLRWRTREGRALVAMTLSPLNPQFYDHLGVWLATSGWRESLALSFTGWVGFLTFVATAPHDLRVNPRPAYLAVTLGVYLPATAMLLWSRNRGNGHQPHGLPSSTNSNPP